MTETNIELEPTCIHPAINFTSEHAYVGQKVHDRHSPRSSLVIVSDTRDLLDFEDVLAEIRNVHLRCIDFNMEQRWSTEGMNNYIQGGEPLESAKLFSRIRALFRAYVELSDERLYDLLTLWSIGTYFHRLFNAYPYLYVGGISGSGKTKLLTLCSLVCFNSEAIGAASCASLFRRIQSTRCSLFLDESDSLSSRNATPDIWNLMVCGYKKGLRVLRARKNNEGNFEAESFDVYSPKLLVNIDGLEGVLQNRCINIFMQIGSDTRITDTEVTDNDPIWQQLRDMIYPFLLKNWKEVRRTYAQITNDRTLRNRDWELWKPIFVLAQFFGGPDLLARMKSLSLEKTEENIIDNFERHEYVLIDALLSIVGQDGFYRLAKIKEEMKHRLDEPVWLSEKYVGGLLRRLGFSNRRRVGAGTEYFVKASVVKDLAKRLGIGVDSEHSERPGGQDTQKVVTEVILKGDVVQ
jgi:hypothetical protein